MEGTTMRKLRSKGATTERLRLEREGVRTCRSTARGQMRAPADGDQREGCETAESKGNFAGREAQMRFLHLTYIRSGTVERKILRRFEI